MNIIYPFEYYHAFKNHHWTSGGCHGMRIEKTNDISSKVRIAIQFYPLLLRFSSQKRGWKHKCASHGKSILNVSLYNTMPLQQHKRWKSIFDPFWMYITLQPTQIHFECVALLYSAAPTDTKDVKVKDKKSKIRRRFNGLQNSKQKAKTKIHGTSVFA